jgi:DNA-binding NarL/FixJ family response regulator
MEKRVPQNIQDAVGVRMRVDHLLRGLTPRERQVAAAVAHAASNHEAADTLSMAPRTVECHLTRIYMKLGVTTRLQLAVVLGGRCPAGLGSPWSSLSPTERNVATLVSAGMSNKAAATRLYLSPKTVEYHLGRIYRKLCITSRCQLLDVLANLDTWRHESASEAKASTG